MLSGRIVIHALFFPKHFFECMGANILTQHGMEQSPSLEADSRLTGQ
jgi:hypothetical protein